MKESGCGVNDGEHPPAAPSGRAER
jgi:hypothetical protein